MRCSVLLLAALALAAPRPGVSASRQLKFTEYAPQETAVGLAVGLGTTGAVGVATGNPLAAGAAGAAAGTAAAFQTGMLLRVFDCMRTPGECSMSSA